MTGRHRLIEALRTPVHPRVPVRRSTVAILVLLIGLAALYGSIEPTSKAASFGGITVCNASGKCSTYVPAPASPKATTPAPISTTTSTSTAPITSVPSTTSTPSTTSGTVPNETSTTQPRSTVPRSPTTTPSGATSSSTPTSTSTTTSP